MFDWFRNLFSSQEQLPEVAQPSEQEIADMMFMANAAPANGAMGMSMPTITAAHLAAAPMSAPIAVNENAPGLSEQADVALTKLLAAKHLHLDVAGAPKAIRWLKSAQVTAPLTSRGGHVYMGGGGATQQARLLIEFNGKSFGDFTPKSINEAVHGVLASVPALKGHIKEAPLEVPTYGEVWKQLEGALKRHPEKFPAGDIEALKGYFMTTEKAKFHSFSTGGHFDVAHPDGVVQFKIDPSWDAQLDNKSNTSSDQDIIDYLKAHKAEIKNYIIEKATALNIEGVTKESLANLEVQVGTTGQGYSQPITFSVGVLNGDKLTESALAKVNTEKLKGFFLDAVIDESKPLPKMLPFVANGEMIGKILKARAGNDPDIAKLLSNDHFLPAEAAKAKHEAESKANIIELPSVTEIGDNKHVIDYTFNLPPGIDLQEFRKSLASTLQHQVASGMSHGDSSLLSA